MEIKIARRGCHKTLNIILDIDLPWSRPTWTKPFSEGSILSGTTPTKHFLHKAAPHPSRGGGREIRGWLATGTAGGRGRRDELRQVAQRWRLLSFFLNMAVGPKKQTPTENHRRMGRFFRVPNRFFLGKRYF